MVMYVNLYNIDKNLGFFVLLDSKQSEGSVSLL